MNKKGLFWWLMPLILMLLAVALLGGLIWFGFRISDGITSVVEFLQSYWWAILIAIALIGFKKQIIAIFNMTIGRFAGIKLPM